MIKTNTIYPQSSQFSEPIVYSYINTTNQIQMVRINNFDNSEFERIIFPGQRLVFEAAPDDKLEIYTGMNGEPILSKMIFCSQLD